MKTILGLIFTLLLVGCSEKETVREVVQPIYIEKDAQTSEEFNESEEKSNERDQEITDLRDALKISEEQRRKIAATKECIEDEIRNNLANVKTTCEELLSRETQVVQIDSNCSEPKIQKCESQSFIQDYEVVQDQMTELDKLEYQLKEKTQCYFKMKDLKDDGKNIDLILSDCKRSPDEENYGDILDTIARYVEISDELLSSEHLFARQQNILNEKNSHLKNYQTFLKDKLLKMLKNYQRDVKTINTKPSDSRSKGRCRSIQRKFNELFRYLGNQSEISWNDVQSEITSCLNN